MSFIDMHTFAEASQYKPGEQLSLSGNKRKASRYAITTYLETMSTVSLVLEYTVYAVFSTVQLFPSVALAHLRCVNNLTESEG